jgi:hypothetical protein
MVTHMKTTVEISNAIGRAARRAAEREGTTLRALVEEGLRRVLDDRARSQAFRLRTASFRGQGLDPAVTDGGWARIREMAYEGRS